MSGHTCASTSCTVGTVVLQVLIEEETSLIEAAARLAESKRAVSTLERRVDILRQAAKAYAEYEEQTGG